jgi:signal transduction histidine kinase
MVTLYDMSGKILLQNVTSAADLQLGKEIGLTTETFLPYVLNRNDAEKILNSILEGREITLQTKVLTKKGKRYHLIRALKILDPTNGGDMILIHEEDITETVKQQKESTANKMAASVALKQQKLKDRFLANTNHELKTPLHGDYISLVYNIRDYWTH